MAWVDLVTGQYTGSNANGGGLKVTIQYDNSSITTTSVTLRTKAWFPSGNSSTDTYFIYSNGGTISRICYLNGHATGGSSSRGSNPYYGNRFTLSKTNTATYFSMPEVKICNDGHHRDKSAYTDSNGRGADMYWTSAREDWSSMLNSGGTKLTTSVYVTSIGRGTTTITDNYNNTFTITATKGANGSYNTAGGPFNLKYGYSSSARNTTYTSGSAINLSTSGTADTRTVYAESTTTATHGSDQVATASQAIKQYLNPGAPGTPSLDDSSYKNGRLTVKQNWSYTWPAATKTNNTSPIKGYRIRLYKNNSLIKGLTVGSGNTISKGNGTNEYIDRDSTSCTVTFNPVTMGFAAGDTVKLGIYSYSKYGNDNSGDRFFNGGGLGNAMVESESSTVQNAGVMRVKPNDTVGWKEGVVWVKVNKGGTVQWVEADVVQVKTSAGWKESI